MARRPLFTTGKEEYDSLVIDKSRLISEAVNTRLGIIVGDNALGRINTFDLLLQLSLYNVGESEEGNVIYRVSNMPRNCHRSVVKDKTLISPAKHRRIGIQHLCSATEAYMDELIEHPVTPIKQMMLVARSIVNNRAFVNRNKKFNLATKVKSVFIDNDRHLSFDSIAEIIDRLTSTTECPYVVITAPSFDDSITVLSTLAWVIDVDSEGNAVSRDLA